MTMTREIYEALKRHIEVITPESDKEQYARLIEDYHTMDCTVVWGTPFYRFFADGLNEGLSEFDADFIDSFIQPIRTRNLWNVCQRFYSFISNYPNINQRLLV